MKITSPWSEVTKHLIFLAVGWFMFCILAGLFQTFDLLEASTETSQISAILGGLKISCITLVIGVIVISSVPAIFHSIKKREP